MALQVGAIVSTMQRAPSDGRPIGGCNGQARDCRQMSDYTGGPFDTEAEVNDFVLDLLRGTPAPVKAALAGSLRTGSRVVFTHADITPRNILVQVDRVQALLDWEYAGWYPEHWEYVKFFDRPTACKDWKDHAEYIFETHYPQQLVIFQALARWQRP